MDPLNPATFAQRPRFWLLAAAEWSVFFATILWSLGVGLLILLRRRGSAIP
ncbi:MAG: hypothetical protein ABSF77_13090 [Spirochaetia bacterium]